MQNRVTFATIFSRYITTIMRRFFRLTLALFAAISLVSSTLVTSGFACLRSDSDGAMADMAMASTSAPISSAWSQRSAPGEAPVSPSSAPCQSPWGPTSCQTMVPCSNAAVAAQQIVVSDASREMVRVASAATLTPPSETKAPEPPPPRA